MRERLARLYKAGKLTKEQLHWWVGKGITEKDYKEMIKES